MRAPQLETERQYPGVGVLIFGVAICVIALALSIGALASFESQREYFCVELSNPNGTEGGAAMLQYKLDSGQFNYRTFYHSTLGVVSEFQVLEWLAPDTNTPVLELCDDCVLLGQSTCINEALPANCQFLAAEIEADSDLISQIRRRPLAYTFVLRLDTGVELHSHSMGSTCPFF